MAVKLIPPQQNNALGLLGSNNPFSSGSLLQGSRLDVDPNLQTRTSSFNSLAELERFNQENQPGARKNRFFKGLRDLGLALQGVNPTAYDIQQQQLLQVQEDENRKRQLIASLPEDIQRIYGVYGPDAAFKAQYGTTTDNSTQLERDRQRLTMLEKIPVELRSPEDNQKLIMLEQSVYGAPKIIPFYDSSGKVAKSITSINLAKDPGIVKRFEKQGLFTVGQKPSAKFEGKESTFNIMGDDFLQAQSQLNTYNDLASIIDENRDAFTVAGSIGNLINSARYEIQSAERLINLNNFQNNNPAEYSKLTASLEEGETDTGISYSDILDKLSQDRAVAKSIFLKLAYGTAKEIDPSGRLSDNDVKIAMDILSNLGFKC